MIPGSDAGAPPPQALAECFEPDQESTRRLPGGAAITASAGSTCRQLGRDGGARYPRRDRTVSRRKHRASPKSPCRWRARTCACWWKANRWRATPSCAWRACARTEAGTSNWIRVSCPPLLDFNASDYLTGNRAPPGGDSLRAVQRHRRTAPPEESEPGRFHRGRHRQFLAALHHQHRIPAYSGICSKPAAAIPSRCSPPCWRWPAA